MTAACTIKLCLQEQNLILSLASIAVITIVRHAANISVPKDCKKQLQECKNVNSTGHSSLECMRPASQCALLLENFISLLQNVLAYYILRIQMNKKIKMVLIRHLDLCYNKLRPQLSLHRSKLECLSLSVIFTLV